MCIRDSPKYSPASKALDSFLSLGLLIDLSLPGSHSICVCFTIITVCNPSTGTHGVIHEFPDITNVTLIKHKMCIRDRSSNGKHVIKSLHD